MGSETNYAQTALLFIEPEAATLAVVDSADGSVTDIHRLSLSDDDDTAVGQLTELISQAESLPTRPDTVFLVGSGIDLPLIKPTLEASTTLPVTAAEEPDTALARGAALAAASSPLFASSTAAQAWAGGNGDGAVGGIGGGGGTGGTGGTGTPPGGANGGPGKTGADGLGGHTS